MSDRSNDFTATKPLAGRTIIVTRAKAQAADFVGQLESYGARVIACPTIEIVEPESYAALDEAIANLYGYDWLVFTSVNAVQYFLRRFQILGHEISELDDLSVCAIGEATAQKLEELHVHVDLIPAESKAEGVFAALENFAGGRDALAGLNFLLPRAAVARDFLPQALEDASARVDVVTAYRTVRPQSPDLTHINALLAGGGVDCIAFTSSSTVRHFAQLFDTNDLSELLKGVAVASIGDITARTAAELGLHTEIAPAEFKIPALASAIVAYFDKAGAEK